MPEPLKPILALVGSDPFLQLEALHDIERRIPGVERVEFDGEKAPLVEVLDEVRSFSMFSTAKVVVVRFADDFVEHHREKLEDFVKAVGDKEESLTGTLVFRLNSFPGNTRLHKLVAKVGAVIKCEPPNAAALPGWIVKRAKSVHRVEITPPAAAQLAELIGNNLGRLDSEIGRLTLMLPDPPAPQAITPDIVENSVAFQREQEVRQITALLARGQTERALVRWRQLLITDPAAEFKAATWLMMWLEKARIALDLKDQGVPLQGMSSALWLRDPNEIRDFVAVASRLGRSGIADLFARLTELDRRSKSGLGDAAMLIERFMATAVPR